METTFFLGEIKGGGGLRQGVGRKKEEVIGMGLKGPLTIIIQNDSVKEKRTGGGRLVDNT